MKSLLISKIINRLEDLDVSVLKNLWQDICTHETIKEPKRKDDSPSAQCDDCSASLGWYCNESPDKTCYYYSSENPLNANKRVVQLRNGTVHNLESNHSYEYETDDCCLFCGAPEERK